ncbi:MAG: O-antigen ligase family protein [Verrucomicrobia bacterium]|nr:O-antigen ligase family protein [Verrucomicrobiota bacterium]
MRTHEVFLFGQTTVLVVVISWAKAGHLSPWAEWFTAATVLGGLLGVLLLRKGDSLPFAFPWKPMIPFALFVALAGASMLNPSHNPPSQIPLDLERFEDAALRAPALVPFVGDEFRDVQRRSVVDSGQAIALFYRFRRDFQDKFDRFDSPFEPFIEDYESKLKRTYTAWLPSCVTADASIWKRCYPIAILALQAIILWRFMESRRLIRKLLLMIVLNGALLAIAGTFQKLSYVPGDRVKEIWGLWDAPEPRYFFSSFTYKNHWSAFALLCLGGALSLAWREISRKGILAWREPKAGVCLVAALFFGITIPLSGSRSGTFLLIIFLILLALVLGWSVTRYFDTFIKRCAAFGGTVFACSLTLGILVWFGFNLDRETKSEAIGNTLQQWENYQKGSPPMRYYLWKDTFEMFLDKPVFGHGLGSFRALHPLYQSAEYKKEREYGLASAHRKLKPLTEHSHNDWLQYLAEIGVVGVVLLLLVPTLGIWQNRKSVFSTAPDWALVGCILFAIYSFVDFPTRTPACLLLLSLTLSLALKHASLEKERRARQRH